MTNFDRALVLVHGGYHGAWCFEPMLPFLEARGIRSVAIDLPGHGKRAKFPKSYYARPFDFAAYMAESSPVGDITLNDYVEAVEEAVDGLMSEGFSRVALLGHSMGGLPLTPCGERRPKTISRLIYLAAMLTTDGRSPQDFFATNATAKSFDLMRECDPAALGAVRIPLPSITPQATDALIEAFYATCDRAQAMEAVGKFSCDMPWKPFVTAVQATAAAWGTIPRSYICPEDDLALDPSVQRAMVSVADQLSPSNLTDFHSISGDHSPFLSNPGELARMISELLHD